MSEESNLPIYVERELKRPIQDGGHTTVRYEVLLLKIVAQEIIEQEGVSAKEIIDMNNKNRWVKK